MTSLVEKVLQSESLKELVEESLDKLVELNGGIDNLLKIVADNGAFNAPSMTTTSTAGKKFFGCIIKEGLIPSAKKETAVVGYPLKLENAFIPEYSHNMLVGSVSIFTDGASSKPNGHDKFYGGVGVVAIQEFGLEQEEVIFEYSDGHYDSTVSQEELNGLIVALKYILNNYKTNQLIADPVIPIFVVLDSEYVLKGLCEYYPKTWSRTGWKLAGGGAVKNQGHWKEIINLVDAINKEVPNPYRIKFMHTRGHQGVKYNEHADKLAVAGRKKVFEERNKK